MKKIYSFLVNKIEKVKESQEVEINGEKLTKEVEVEKITPYKFFIKKPTQSLHAEATLFYDIQYSEGVRKGLLTRQLMQKRFVDDGGAFSEKSQKVLDEIINQIGEKQIELEKIGAKTEKTDEDTQRTKDIIVEITALREKALPFQRAADSLYDSTAESRAITKTGVWWVLHLAYRDEEGKESPFYGDGSYEKRLAKYEEIIDEEDKFLNEVLLKFNFFIGAWAFQGVKTELDFKAIEPLFNPNL